MAEEYRGYVSNRGNVVDWNQAAQGLSGAVKNVQQARDSRRAENERIKQESEGLINATEQPKSKTLNEFVLKGADQGRSKLMEWNKQLKSGELKANDYKQRIANLNEYWGSLATTAKSLDQRMTQAMARQQVGEDGTLPPASAIEAEMQMYFGGLSQLGDKKVVIGDDGRVAVGKYDPDGNLLSTEDVKYINNPANVEFNRTDLSGMVQADVKNWGDWSIGRVSDLRQNPQFIKSKSRLVDALVGTPRSAASILVDNTDGDYQVFFTAEDKAAKVQKMKDLYSQMGQPKTDAEIEAQMIQMRQDENGDYQPILTDTQKAEAKKLVESEIEIQVGREVTPAPAYSGGSNYDASEARDIQNEKDSNLEGYRAVRKAWNNADYSGLRSGFEYKRSGTGDNYKIDVYKITPPTKRDGERVLTLVKTITSPEGLAEYAFNGDPNTNLSNYKEGKRENARLGLGDDRKKSSSSAPKVGTVQDGYKFIGGDPSDPKNWKKV